MTDRQYGCACFLRRAGRSFSAPTVSINQDARVAVTVPSSAPPIINPNATSRPTGVTG
jgi:hypothetical protein